MGGRPRQAPQTSAAFAELVDAVRELEEKLQGADPPLDDVTVLEGYKWILSILQVGSDAYVWADPGRPRFVDIVGPYKKWGGDNADAFYQYAPVDPARTYRVRGRRGDAVYLSLTVYGGPDDGRYSERIVGSVNDRDLAFDPGGGFELGIGPEPGDGPWITTAPDAVCAITRDYLVEPTTGRRVEWAIEAVDPPATFTQDDADLARRLRATTTWMRQQATIVPLPVEGNGVDEPYPVPTTTFGWAAGDAAYAMGSFDLAEDEALVIEGRSPACAFWNLCLWNPFLHTYNYDYEQVTINGGQVQPEADGSWRIVVAARDPAHPNWVSTAGHRRGRLWFRWFLPEALPERPRTAVVPVAEVG
ncbi:MAG: hypothetical protein K0R11_1204 [Acidimicrobiales bacterium]|nr:hypothetical protein [Acidimicrobiales bacterium]